jgi:metal-responsive CopG/Arc/MetJ family transcriptional regulator
MAAKRKAKVDTSKRMKRMSVGFPPELYEVLEQIADQQKVSVGWVVRDAAEKYVSERWPLLGQPA